MSPIDHQTPQTESTPTGSPEEIARQQAIEQIERRRHFHFEMAASAVGMVILTAIWAMSEYHNAGGWPSDGFSESSGIPHVWNYWIIYPLIAWLLIMAARARAVYGHKPISEDEIRRELDRQSRGH